MFGGKRSPEGVSAVLDFLHSLNVKTRLRDYGIEHNYLDEYAGYVIGRSATKNSPAEVTYEGIRKHLEEIY